MQSSTGQHYLALDHVRAIAALLVVTWHFIHGSTGFPIAFDYSPNLFLLSLFDEGHTGVALFMTLSGYLFAKLLNGKTIDYKAFLWNRALRLLPLLTVVTAASGLYLIVMGKTSPSAFLQTVTSGILLPTLPNGGWSITVEFHYYLILPLLLWMLRHSRWLPASVLLLSIAFRTIMHQSTGEVQTLAYWTIIGRIDQFVLGMLAFQFRLHLAHRHGMVVLWLGSFAGFYAYFNALGGFMAAPAYPSPSSLWVLLPTIEGASYAVAIAWYDSSFSPPSRGFSKYLGYAGAYSYSIYLVHYNLVFRVARFIDQHIMSLTNFYVALAWALFFFLLMVALGHFSFRYIESPFLRHRKRYIHSLRDKEVSKDHPAQDSARLLPSHVVPRSQALYRSHKHPEPHTAATPLRNK